MFIRQPMSRSLSELILTDQEKSWLLSTFPHGLVVFDLETTGLSPLVNKIIEIAAIKLDGNGVITFFHQLVNPMVEMSPENSAIHGLYNADLVDMPGLRHPLKDFFNFAGDLSLWAHNGVFDAGFLIRGAHELNIQLPALRIYDSCRLIKTYYKSKEKKPENFKLVTLADYFSFKFHSHMAMNDSVVLIKIMAQVINVATQEEFKSSHEKAYVFSLKDFKSPNLNHFPSHLREMISYVEKRTPLAIRYDGGNVKGEWREIIPLAFLPMPRGPVLLGKCLNTQQHKSYVLKLVKEFKVMEKVMPTPPIEPEIEVTDVQ